MDLEAIALGAPLPEPIRRAATWSDAGDRSFGSLADAVGERQRRWTITLRDDRVVELSLFTEGTWEELVPEYETLVSLLTVRHGAPASAPPDEDEQRHVELEPVERPDDRYFHLRSRGWEGTDRATVSIYKVWPGTLRLRMSAARR